MAATAKTSVALGLEELEWARARAAREGKSLSAVLTECVRFRRKLEAWSRVRDQLMAAEPPISDEERRTVEAEFFGDTSRSAPTPRRRKRRAKATKKAR